MFHASGPPCIVGRYRLLAKTLGKGHYARVEEAEHLDVDTRVAIKMVDIHTVKDKYVLRNLHREASVLRSLRHPNIIAIFEALRAGSHYCLVTELAGGGELCAHVSNQPGGHLDEQTTLQFSAQLISAVAHMHSFNVVHRDIKMKNIVLTAHGDQVKLVDFGLGRTWSQANPLETRCGSPGYAAPEIYQRDKPYGPAVDLWSLGVVLYYMAVGRMPFPPSRSKDYSYEERKKRLVALISRGVTEQHIKLMRHFSPDFRDLVQGLLTPNVARRLTLQQTVDHPWVSNRLRSRQMLNIHYKLTSQERALILAKVALTIKTTVQSIEAQYRQNPLGEVAAMYNILAHKQLARYHTTWAVRPLNPPRKLAFECKPTPAPAPSSYQYEVVGPESEELHEGRVEQPDSSTASSVHSKGANIQDVDEQLPDRDVEDTEPTSSAPPTTTLSPERATSLDTEAPASLGAGVANFDIANGTLDQVADSALPTDDVARVMDMACLLRDPDGKEKLETVPETKVMFYTEATLDNIHEALTSPAKSGTVYRIKSALASQTGLAARTRKAVSFSIIGSTLDSGVQVDFRGPTCDPESLMEEAQAAELPSPPEELQPVKGPEELQPAKCPEELQPTKGPEDGGLLKQSIALAQRLLNTVPVTRKMSPEPKKHIHEARRWPLRSPRTVYKQMKGQTKMSVSYLLDNQNFTAVTVTKTDQSKVSLTSKAPSLVPTHVETVIENNNEDDDDDDDDTVDNTCSHKSNTEENIHEKDASHSQNSSWHWSRRNSQEKGLNVNDSRDIESDGAKSTKDLIPQGKAICHRGSSSQRFCAAETFNAPFSPCTKKPLNAVAELMKTKLQVMKAQKKPTSRLQKQLTTKERRSVTPKFYRFFPNRYRVDLALVMTIERSRKQILPSIRGPWTSKPQSSLKPSKRATKLSKPQNIL